MSVVENPRVQGLEVSMNRGPPVQVHTKLGILFGVYRDYTGYIAKYPSSTLLPFLFESASECRPVFFSGNRRFFFMRF